MDTKTKTKLVNALMTRFVKLYEDKYGRKPHFNRNVEKWGFGDMLLDLEDDTQATLEYYFSLRRNHSSQDLLRNYDSINVWRQEDIDDENHRRLLAELTKQRVEENRVRWQRKP